MIKLVHQISFRVTQDELFDLGQKATEQGLPISAWLRHLLGLAPTSHGKYYFKCGHIRTRDNTYESRKKNGYMQVNCRTCHLARTNEYKRKVRGTKKVMAA